jgi:hypothetical protein
VGDHARLTLCPRAFSDAEIQFSPSLEVPDCQTFATVHSTSNTVPVTVTHTNAFSGFNRLYYRTRTTEMR